MAGRRVPFSHPFFTSDPDEFWAQRYRGMPPEFWSSAGFSGPSGQGPPSGFSPSGSGQMSQRSHHTREVTRSGGSGGDFPRSQLMDQYFGGGDPFSDSLKAGAVSPGSFYIKRPDFQRQTSGTSEVTTDENTFKVSLDVQQFTPDELDVRVVDGDVLIHAKHESREDGQGKISREFTRRYNLPGDVDPESVKSSLSQEGVLSIEAPRKRAKEIEGQKVPIKFDGPKSPTVEGAAGGEASKEPAK